METTYDRSNDSIQWDDMIPFDGEVLPSGMLMPPANAAYLWLLENGISSVEARSRIWGGYARPLVAANAWRQEFAGDGAGRDGSQEWYDLNGGPEWQPERATIEYVMSLR